MKSKNILRWAILFFFLYAWFFSTGTFLVASDLMVDLSILLIISILSWVYFNRQRRANTRCQYPILTAIGLFWLTASLVDWQRPHELPITAYKTAVLDESVLIARRVGISLSGGGYRAALFHAGVIDALQSLGIEPVNISAVSGGAIIGSFYRLGGNPVTFKNAVVSGAFNLKREVLLLHNLIRLPFPLRIPTTDIALFPWYRFNRLDVQQGLIERTINPERQSKLKPKNIAIGLSDLNYGMQITAFENTALVFGPKSGLNKQSSFNGFRWDNPTPGIAELVSLSGAFPGAFPATLKTVRVNSGADKGAGLTRDIAIVDGGVIDNLGHSALANLDYYANNPNNKGTMNLDWQSDAIIVSDGGAFFKVLDEVSGVVALARAFSVSDKYKPMSRDLPALWSGQENTNKIIEVSASLAQLQPAARFATDTAAIDHDPDQLGIRPNLMQLDVLREIVGLLSAKHQSSALEAVKRYAENDVTGLVNNRNLAGAKLEKYTGLETTEKCLYALKADGKLTKDNFWEAICRAAEVRISLNTGGKEMLNQFANTRALKDTFRKKTADNIYNLGKLLTYIRLKDLSLKSPSPQSSFPKPASFPTPGVLDKTTD